MGGESKHNDVDETIAKIDLLAEWIHLHYHPDAKPKSVGEQFLVAYGALMQATAYLADYKDVFAERDTLKAEVGGLKTLRAGDLLIMDRQQNQIADLIDALKGAKSAIKGREHTGFIDAAIDKASTHDPLSIEARHMDDDAMPKYVGPEDDDE